MSRASGFGRHPEAVAHQPGLRSPVRDGVAVRLLSCAVVKANFTVAEVAAILGTILEVTGARNARELMRSTLPRINGVRHTSVSA
jgi:hypothetical protein